MIFGLLAALIGPQFFPSADPVAATLSALAVFAVGFAVRPLGGVLLGTVADRIGRRRVMLFSVSVMAVTTLVIALLPTYSSIGVWAGVILLVCRLVQGASTGIEAPLSTAYAVELSPEGREGRAAGLMSFYVNLGILLASLVSFLSSLAIGADAMLEWGWRIPFVFGAVLGLVVVWLRRALPESLTEEDKTEAAAQGNTIWGGIGKHWLGLLAIIFVVGAAQAFNYAWNVGLPSLARGSLQREPDQGLRDHHGAGRRPADRLADHRPPGRQVQPVEDLRHHPAAGDPDDLPDARLHQARASSASPACSSAARSSWCST